MLDHYPFFKSFLGLACFFLFLVFLYLVLSLFYLFFHEVFNFFAVLPLLVCAHTFILFVLFIHLLIHFDLFEIFKCLNYVMLFKLFLDSFLISPLLHSLFTNFWINLNFCFNWSTFLIFQLSIQIFRAPSLFLFWSILFPIPFRSLFLCFTNKCFHGKFLSQVLINNFVNLFYNIMR